MPEKSQESQESNLRKFIHNLAERAKVLKGLATKSPGLQTGYNLLCDTLDNLNEELKDEYEGSIAPSWKKFEK
ncbi:hypothetical protein [Anabaena sp. PCC 7108]|uniref:hypothetical protein n=1 Tax=Anabaena sp. PCC 7108 TaxID=163908 RepID=UPI0003469DC1|nr:hypothetical protein [Anabaena sp. PCC 7108]